MKRIQIRFFNSSRMKLDYFEKLKPFRRIQTEHSITEFPILCWVENMQATVEAD